MRSLLDLGLPTVERFAGAHGYDVVTTQIDDSGGDRGAMRRARWSKVGLLREALHRADAVVWSDADAMFCRFDRDMLDDVPLDCFQGLTLEQFPNRSNPNTGV